LNRGLLFNRGLFLNHWLRYVKSTAAIPALLAKPQTIAAHGLNRGLLFNRGPFFKPWAAFLNRRLF
jgi:hypothetical protein